MWVYVQDDEKKPIDYTIVVLIIQRKVRCAICNPENVCGKNRSTACAKLVVRVKGGVPNRIFTTRNYVTTKAAFRHRVVPKELGNTSGAHLPHVCPETRMQAIVHTAVTTENGKCFDGIYGWAQIRALAYVTCILKSALPSRSLGTLGKKRAKKR